MYEEGTVEHDPPADQVYEIIQPRCGPLGLSSAVSNHYIACECSNYYIACEDYEGL